MKKFCRVAIIGYALLLCGCSLFDDGSSNLEEEWTSAFAPWQLESAKATGLTEFDLRRHVEYFTGSLETRYASSLNAALPPQSTQDASLVDSILAPELNNYMSLRSEMSVLLTKAVNGTHYSLYLDVGVEGGGAFVVAWEKDGDHVEILDIHRAEPPYSTAVLPTVAKVSRRYVLFGLLLNEQLSADGERHQVHSGTFSVTMDDGSVISEDVTKLPGILLFLPNSEFTHWELLDVNGALIWDSFESVW